MEWFSDVLRAEVSILASFRGTPFGGLQRPSKPTAAMDFCEANFNKKTFNSIKITDHLINSYCDHCVHGNRSQIPSMCLGLKIRPRFEYAKKYDSYVMKIKYPTQPSSTSSTTKLRSWIFFLAKKTTFLCNIPLRVQNRLMKFWMLGNTWFWSLRDLTY